MEGSFDEEAEGNGEGESGWCILSSGDREEYRCRSCWIMDIMDEEGRFSLWAVSSRWMRRRAAERPIRSMNGGSRDLGIGTESVYVGKIPL